MSQPAVIGTPDHRRYLSRFYVDRSNVISKALGDGRICPEVAWTDTSLLQETVFYSTLYGEQSVEACFRFLHKIRSYFGTLCAEDLIDPEIDAICDAFRLGECSAIEALELLGDLIEL